MSDLGRAAERLRLAIKGLSVVGVESLPAGRRPDDLAIEFDESYTEFVGGLTRLPAPEQLQALQEIDDQLQSMSDPAHKELWTAAAVKREPVWELVRTIARRALVALDWAD